MKIESFKTILESFFVFSLNQNQQFDKSRWEKSEKRLKIHNGYKQTHDSFPLMSMESKGITGRMHKILFCSRKSEGIDEEVQSIDFNCVFLSLFSRLKVSYV